MEITHVISVDFCTEEGEFIETLNQYMEDFEVAVLHIVEDGPGGGWPEVTFGGPYENLQRLGEFHYQSEEGDDHVKECIEEYQE